MKITVKVKPNSGKNEIKLLDNGVYEVKVTEIPEKGKANRKVAELLSKELKLPKSSIILIRGETSKNKVFEINQ